MTLGYRNTGPCVQPSVCQKGPFGIRKESGEDNWPVGVTKDLVLGQNMLKGQPGHFSLVWYKNKENENGDQSNMVAWKT